MPIIIMDIRLYIAEHILDMDIIGAETYMKTPSTKQKKIILEGHKWLLTGITIDLEH